MTQSGMMLLRKTTRILPLLDTRYLVIHTADDVEFFDVT